MALNGMTLGMLVALVGSVEQIEVDDVGGDTDDTEITQHKRQDVGEIDGTDAR